MKSAAVSVLELLLTGLLCTHTHTDTSNKNSISAIHSVHLAEIVISKQRRMRALRLTTFLPCFAPVVDALLTPGIRPIGIDDKPLSTSTTNLLIGCMQTP